MKKFTIRDFRIKNKRDWIVFWIFAVLIAYVAGDRYNWRVNTWLREIGNPWMTDLNEPQNYGRMIVAVILLAVLAEVVLFLCRKSVRVKLAVLAAGLILPAAIVGIYQLHCKLIVSVLWDEEPSSVYVKYGDTREVWKSGEENFVPAEKWQELQKLCGDLKIVTDGQELKKSMEWYNAEEAFMDTDYYVDLTFPQKYGHGYVFTLRIKDGYVYLWRGYKGQTTVVTFFEDNGITEWLSGEGER